MTGTHLSTLNASRPPDYLEPNGSQIRTSVGIFLVFLVFSVIITTLAQFTEHRATFTGTNTHYSPSTRANEQIEPGQAK